MKDKNGKEIGVGDFVKFKPRAGGPFEVGRIAHLDTHNVPRVDEADEPIQKKKGGVETEPRTGQILYFRGNSTELAYFTATETELVLRAETK